MCTLDMQIMAQMAKQERWANLCHKHAWFKGYIAEELLNILVVVHRT
jgi:hypothetical protein